MVLKKNLVTIKKHVPYYRICVSGLSMHGFNQITDRNFINCMYNLNKLFVIFTYIKNKS